MSHYEIAMEVVFRLNIIQESMSLLVVEVQLQLEIAMEVVFRLNIIQENKSLSVAKVQFCQDLIAFLDAAMGAQDNVTSCQANKVLVIALHSVR